MTSVKESGITQHFRENLARLLSEKIFKVYKKFDSNSHVTAIKNQQTDKRFTELIDLHATELRNYLPESYSKAINILMKILGEENKNETGMFSNFYWIMPIGKFIEKYGLDDFDVSIKAIEEVTKRNTGEYAIRPFIRKYPIKTINIMKSWAKSKNFHLRRLASEGLRPKLPWATKLEVFTQNPKPVFEILGLLKEDEIKFVQKSVANNLTDYLKVNKNPTIKLLKEWERLDNKNTQWIIKRATRKIDLLT